MHNYNNVDSKYHPKIRIPEDCNRYRFILGREGKENLFVIAMNPSKATLETDDDTTLNVIDAAQKLNCDGWFLMNLYPLYSTDSSNVGEYDEELAKRNIEEVRKTLINNHATEVLIAWGDLKTRTLRRCEYEMLLLLKEIDVKAYYYDKMSDLEYPYHPLPLGKRSGWNWIGDSKKYLK